MSLIDLRSHAEGHWHRGQGDRVEILSAIDGRPIADAGSGGLDFGTMVRYARAVGGPALRALTFHQRAAMLKALGQAILARKDALYTLSAHTGATRADSWIDIEGGAGTLLSYASRGRRALPDGPVLIDGEPEILGKGGQFIGLHVRTPLRGVAIHINAYNFPVWGMLEKLGPALLAGMPAIIKPATATAQLAHAAFEILLEAGVLPDGALQFIAGSPGDLFDHLGGQDLVAFTGSAQTATLLQQHPVIAREAVRFTAERDSLNAAVLGPDAAPGTPEFDLFVREVVTEMTVKAGQKCTAIRRALVPAGAIDAVEDAIRQRLGRTVVGDPRREEVRMGALVGLQQLRDVQARIDRLALAAPVVATGPGRFVGDDIAGGAFLTPHLLRADKPWASADVHEIEAFGPVATLMPYADPADAVALANRGLGSLVMSVFSCDPAFQRDVLLGSGPLHGRIAFIDRDCAAESTGHGSPLPMLVHGGPGRAGGGEELGGMRGVHHHMQRTALQGSPAVLTALVGRQMPGAPQPESAGHPFRLRFGELVIGQTLRTPPRTVTLDDIEHFAHFTGDTFYAHMDEEAASRSPIFGGRVAHGYLLLSFAAGLFVDPDEGPVLANFGLEGLRFVKPVKPGDSIAVALTVKEKSARAADMGEVRWAVLLTNQSGETVAAYDLLTMNAH